ncbi:hypothetical protein [Ralstonia mannitolilytica]|uniref:hypothetical protein n=1 Tax=Ralstonia mannitolilytica TaxID=105219 RepID=UPI001C9800D5|nr:hypothetical protein [Ralstonia mannitolilytica]MBY4717564.1 hypothetical protein [Ralstonia mannitolilytica]
MDYKTCWDINVMLYGELYDKVRDAIINRSADDFSSYSKEVFDVMCKPMSRDVFIYFIRNDVFKNGNFSPREVKSRLNFVYKMTFVHYLEKKARDLANKLDSELQEKTPTKQIRSKI